MNLISSSEPISQLPNPDLFCASLISKMTLEEKIGQMVQADLSWHQDVAQLIRGGRVGSVLTIRDADQINALQKIAVDESRLGIPLLVGNDTIHGYRTIFPIPLALSCSWDPALVREVASVIALEASASGTNWIFAPMVDICRDARWGRIAEGAGEDSFLCSGMAKVWVEGFQNTPHPGGRPAAACVKHYAGYGAAEAGKDYNTVDMSELRLRQDYLPPFQAAVQAGVETIMTSFNELNGIPATANTFLLQDILRGEWGFEGVVVSDYDSIGELIFHGFAVDHREASLKSFRAGVDIDMMGDAYHFHLQDLVHEGVITEAQIDSAVEKILLLKIKLGLFADPYVDTGKLPKILNAPAHLDLALKAAEESAVLLKNDLNLLPIQPAGKTIALIGPLADERQSLLGSWCFDGRAEETESLLEAFQRTLPEGSHLIYVPGCTIDGDQADFDSTLEAARQADIILMALGESDQMSGEAHSRARIGLPGQQQALLETVCATGKPTIALLFSGRPLAIPWMAENVPAILLAWQGGSKAAQAIANLVLGQASPCGKLTTSFPRSEGQIPVYYAHKSTGRPHNSSGILQFNEAHKSTYLDESNLPLFPFGYGLSYTSFAYGDLDVETPVIAQNGNLVVSAAVTNTGRLDGSEIVQCYIRDLVGSITRPVKELKGFQKVLIKAGETRTVRFIIPVTDLGFFNTSMQYRVEPGEFNVWIGPNSQEGPQGSFRVE